ncbi:MAG: acyltransferase [Gammaproteobacteria bacterium]|nr:acyltransferase [Gammaproteobacteria bacterium]
MQTQYRPEVDGLRAIAVVAVLIYHAGFYIGDTPILPGGFLGVDVFFVISGYFITLILLKEIDAGSFSLSNFYERRARRILPVLIVVMLVSSGLAWLTMLPKPLNEYAGSQLASILFGANFWFWLEDSYTAEASELKPLLHIWSLSLEEQFYVVFPALLLLVLGWKKYTKSQLAVFLAGFFMASLAWAQYSSSRYIDANFYLPLSRSWELLAGAIVATLERTHGRDYLQKSQPAFGPVLGLTMIVVPLALFHDDWQHPSFLTLVPVLGTALLIWSTPKQSVCYKILASRPFVAIGLISYSLYLWHFPALAFAKTISIKELTDAEKILCLLASLLLAAGGYSILEKPARIRKLLPSPVFFSLLALSTTLLVGFSAYVLVHNGAAYRLGEAQFIFDGARLEDSFVVQDGHRCDLRPITASETCLFEAPGNSSGRTIINLGDSHADTLGNALLQLAKGNNWHYRHLTLGGCPYVEAAYRFKFGDPTRRCDAPQMQNFKSILAASPPSIVVYSARLPGYITGKPFDNLQGGKEPQESNRRIKVDPQGGQTSKTIEQLIHQTIENIIRMGHIVVLVYPIPEVGWDVPKHVKLNLDQVPNVYSKIEAFKQLSITTSYTVYKDRIRSTVEILDRIKPSPALIRVKPDRIFCSAETDRCYTHNDTALYYYDDNHLSQTGAKMLVDLIAQSLDKRLTTQR